MFSSRRIDNQSDIQALALVSGGSSADVTAIQTALGTPTTANVASEIVKRDENGKVALSILETGNIVGSPDSGGTLNLQGDTINLSGLNSTKQVSFDAINGMLNLSSSDPFGIFTPDSDLIVASSHTLYLNGSDVLYYTTPSSGNSVANKSYVDQVLQNAMAGLSWKNPVRLKTVGYIPAYLTTGSQALRTYTANSNGALVIDSVAVAVGDRILLDQSISIPWDGGIFTVVNAGGISSKWILQRATDANNNPGVEVVSGMGMCVTEGATAGGKQYVLTTPDPIVLGTTSLNFALFSAGLQAMGGELSGTTNNAVVSNSAVLGKLLTGFSATTEQFYHRTACSPSPTRPRETSPRSRRPSVLQPTSMRGVRSSSEMPRETSRPQPSHRKCPDGHNERHDEWRGHERWKYHHDGEFGRDW